MSIYTASSYKSALKDELSSKKSLGVSVTFEKMAKACRVQKTYLSKVLNHDGELNSDQVFAACEYLELSEGERDFIEVLHAYDTSVNQSRKQKLKTEIEGLRKQHLKTETQLKIDSNTIAGRNLDEYYLDPELQLLHVHLTIERFAKNPELILNSVRELDRARLQQKLRKLIELGIIHKLSGGQYAVTKSELHLPASAQVFQAYRSLLRAKAMNRLGSLGNEDSYSFSVLFSSNEKVRRQIQEKFLLFLKETQALVMAQSEGEVYYMNFDLFRWS